MTDSMNLTGSLLSTISGEERHRASAEDAEESNTLTTSAMENRFGDFLIPGTIRLTAPTLLSRRLCQPNPLLMTRLLQRLEISLSLLACAA